VITVATQIIGALAPWYLKKKRGKFQDTSSSHADVSLRLRQAVEVLGPTYIKLGQIISSGEGLFPAELVDQFK
jgi:ubiquinone biosynthesis protein